MNPLPTSNPQTGSSLEQVIAREHYEKLRERLVALQSAPESNAADIDAVIQALTLAQMIYKATYGLIGNNPIEDPPLDAA